MQPERLITRRMPNWCSCGTIITGAKRRMARMYKVGVLGLLQEKERTCDFQILLSERRRCHILYQVAWKPAGNFWTEISKKYKVRVRTGYVEVGSMFFGTDECEAGEIFTTHYDHRREDFASVYFDENGVKIERRKGESWKEYELRISKLGELDDSVYVARFRLARIMKKYKIENFGG